MLTVNIISVGKLKEDYLRKAQAEYQKRLIPYCKLNFIEISEYKIPSEPTDSLVKKCIEVEGENILSKIKGVSIPLCIEGKLYSSEEMASLICDIAMSGKSEISFVIGGSYGLSDSVKKTGETKLSMSKMTFPHQLAKIMLLEQVYRACQINNNGKYHK